MPRSKGKRETIALPDLLLGLASGDTKVIKKITRKGSRNRLAFMTIASMSNTSTPEQKAEAYGEIKYALMHQAGREINKKIH